LAGKRRSDPGVEEGAIPAVHNAHIDIMICMFVGVPVKPSPVQPIDIFVIFNLRDIHTVFVRGHLANTQLDAELPLSFKI